MPLLPPAVVLSKFSERLNGKDRTRPFVAVERREVMLNENVTSAERATLIGLVQVTLRTDESARLRYLKGTEVMDVLSKGAQGCGELVVMKEKSKCPAGTRNSMRSAPHLPPVSSLALGHAYHRQALD